MNKILLLSLLILASCSRISKYEEQKQIASKNIHSYLLAQMTESENNMTIDSFVVSSIDTLTEKKSIEIKMMSIEKEFENLKPILVDQKNILASSISLKMDKYLIDNYASDLEKSINKGKKLNIEYDSLKNKLPKLDNVNFKCYLVKGKAYYTEKLVSKSIELEITTNEKFLVIDPKDF